MSEVGWSVVVPTHRRPRSVVATVEAAARLELPSGGFEVVVVDDGGGDELAELQGRRGVRLVRRRNGGPAAARNSGAAAARGRFVAFLDDDCRPEPGWLVALERALAGREDTLAGGHTLNALAGSTWSAASQDLVDALYRRANGGEEPRFFTSNNVALSLDAFRTLGGFDESFPLAGGEDRAFCHAWRAEGRGMVAAPAAVVLHHHVLDAPGFWRQHYRYGRGARRFYASVGEGELRARGVLAAARFGAEVVLQPLRSAHPGRRVRRSLALVLAQAATAAGSLVEGRAMQREVAGQGG